MSDLGTERVAERNGDLEWMEGTRGTEFACFSSNGRKHGWCCGWVERDDSPGRSTLNIGIRFL
eukprot:scaffold656_cov403-Pavlova_lutheri.AAC.56